MSRPAGGWHWSTSAAVICALIVLIGCGRTRSPRPNASAAGKSAQTGAAGTAGKKASQPSSGMGGDSQPVAPMSPGNPTLPMGPNATPPLQFGPSAGRSGMPVGGAPVSPDMPPPPPPPPGSFTNPANCTVDEPTVLTIDPGGQSGSVSGWLGAGATLAFDSKNLPSFGSGLFMLDGRDNLELLWSVATIDPVDDEGSLYFYALSPATDLAVATDEAIGDASELSYVTDTVGPLETGQVVVWHDRPTDRYVALRVVRLYGTEGGERRATCAAVDARWVFAEEGTARFPHPP